LWSCSPAVPEVGNVARKRRVLVVDDEKIIRMLFRRILREDEVELECAGSGSEASEKLQAAPYDIVFLDVMMPEIGGIEMLKELHKKGVRVPPVVMMTGYTAEGQVKEAFQYGAIGCIFKPFNIKEVLDILKVAFENGQGEQK